MRQTQRMTASAVSCGMKHSFSSRSGSRIGSLCTNSADHISIGTPSSHVMHIPFPKQLRKLRRPPPQVRMEEACVGRL